MFIFTAKKNLFYKKVSRQVITIAKFSIDIHSMIAKDSKKIIKKGTSGLHFNIAHSRSIRITTSNLYVTAHILYSDIRHRTGHKWNYILIIYSIYNIFLFPRELYFMYIFYHLFIKNLGLLYDTN